MITKLEIDGFKTFRDFQVELAPFQVIVCPNGAGKSNLFDAIQLLAHLANDDLRTAFQELRGEAGEILALTPDGRPVDRMRLTAEVFVDRKVQDSWGAQATIKYTCLRYELEIARRTDSQGLERLYVDRESLTAIPRGDGWAKHHGISTRSGWLPSLTGGRSPFISTAEGENGIPTISLHQDLHGGRKSGVAAKVERTLLSGAINTESPTAFAVREEMRSWRFLQLNLKARLREVLATVQAGRTRRRRTQRKIADIYEPLARQIDLNRLRQAPSFARFQDDLFKGLAQLGFIR